MQKKTYTLVECIVGACGTIACAVVAYLEPPMTPAIVGAIGAVVTAVNGIMALFIK